VTTAADPAATDPLLAAYRAVRRTTEALCAPLEVEDYVPQAMPDASPPKWHLAHTTWFFETFVLRGARADHAEFDPRFNYLFNSYYEAVGPRHPRPQRGLLTRPTVAEVYRYRAAVDDAVAGLPHRVGADAWRRLAPVLTLGLHHEQQHQELLVTDLKYAFSCNPLLPAYHGRPADGPAGRPAPPRWLDFPAGLREIGHAGDGFAFDNETPRHRVCVEAFRLADRLVTNGEFLGFIDDGGYRRPSLWLSDGWRAVQEHGWEAPLYWRRQGGGWEAYTLAGPRPVAPAEPVTHLSYFEADAFARWAEARLPTESEWETAAETVPVAGHGLDTGRLHPASLVNPGAPGPHQMFDLWQWTASPYTPYPGYRPAAGALGEYNGNLLLGYSPNPQGQGLQGLAEYNAKFFFGGMVLRGGSCATPASHLRRTYRNYFHPSARWQFTGIRLARDV
jgi:ergothioneine biosynthesis protein EgtB